MKPSRWPRFQLTTVSTARVICSLRTELSSSESRSDILQIVLQEKPPENPSASEYSAAVKIQSAYRSHLVRELVRKIAAVNSEGNYWQGLLQTQETVDAVRSSEKERLRMNEALMRLLLRLDSVPGLDPNVRDLRRHVSRRIVGLQEILDAVSDSRVDGFLRDWEEMVAGIETQVCKERGGGYEMERFCAEHLGFRCLQRFLSDQ